MRRAMITMVLCSGCLLAQDRPEGEEGAGDVASLDGGDDGQPRAGWVALSAGFSNICALHEDGGVWCGRANALRRIDDESYVSLGGYDHNGACAVRDDGTLVCGLGSFADEPTFELDGPFVEVSGSPSAGCGLRSGGGARCWPEAHTVNGPFATVSAGDRFACGIDEYTDELRCWGIDSLVFIEALEDVPGGSFADVATANHVGCALSNGGTVQCWGYDYNGALWGPPAGTYVDLWLSDDRGCAIAQGGRAQCWGDGAGDPNHPELSPPSDASLSSLALGNDFGCGITNDDGAIVCWGAPS